MAATDRHADRLQRRRKDLAKSVFRGRGASRRIAKAIVPERARPDHHNARTGKDSKPMPRAKARKAIHAPQFSGDPIAVNDELASGLPRKRTNVVSSWGPIGVVTFIAGRPDVKHFLQDRAHSNGQSTSEAETSRFRLHMKVNRSALTKLLPASRARSPGWCAVETDAPPRADARLPAGGVANEGLIISCSCVYAGDGLWLINRNSDETRSGMFPTSIANPRAQGERGLTRRGLSQSSRRF